PVGLRDGLYGPEWRSMAGGKDKSRLTIKRADVTETYKRLHGLWVGDAAFPASQAYGALRQSQDGGKLATQPAQTQAEAALDAYKRRAGTRFNGADFGKLPGDRLGLQLAF